MAIVVRDLGVIEYQKCWDLQVELNEIAAADGTEHLLLLEHPAVLTIGRRPDPSRNLRVTRDELAARGIPLIETDRGGDITYHGPGQLVAYPILRLIDRQLSVGKYVRTLLDAVIAALNDLGVNAHTDREAIGVWCHTPSGPAKICALGVRVRKGVTLHGIALNVTTDLNAFETIVPCGIADRGVTSLSALLGDATPTMAEVKPIVANRLLEFLDEPARGELP